MGATTATPAEPHPPLEAFLRDYAEVCGGLWDEVEPQVYDLMLPPGVAGAGRPGGEPEVVRVAFDPEALPEHPGAQLASYGTPLVDRLLADALGRGRRARLALVGLNLSPQGLNSRIGRALTFPDTLTLRLERTRPMHFPQAVFWFEATFASDQKEQELLPVAVDLHYGRQVRHLEPLLDRSRLADEPRTPLPEAHHVGLAGGYAVARERVVRTVAALANTRVRELNERLERQVERMNRYYADLRAEVDEQAERLRDRGEDTSKHAARREALEREERLRIAELRQKSTLTVRQRLVSLLVIDQPKLLLQVSAQPKAAGASPTRLELVWDPLVEVLEALACPTCGQPTYALDVDRQGRLFCPACRAKAPPARPGKR
jgi:hypothetical protein